ncbi:mandelate racemase/muconate lactonizing protein [Caballeronia hypogeia]|uniref:Mandelate racemase/muconate lactonizing protein n=1 Tax=Caballeronia hypogeia TaxID=1777140 RepID=A0A157ZGP8_9BURK|nr:D-mannonate dehydratase ManD [Caballeronia hypogeia]SAK44711.1 mandelate racemase/muconate lactonizing protein [Caballeronia hypogeia]
MKIIRADVIVTCPGRNFVTLKIETDEGIHGIGDATLNGRELAVASYLKDHVCPLLIGRDAGRIEDTWQFLYKGAYWRRGPVTMSAIAAVDMALWDILGKAANMPLYKLLGGASREGVMVYGHATGRDIPEALDRYAEHIEEGYKAIRIQCGVPNMRSVYGVAKGNGMYEPATKGAVEEQSWSSEKYLDFVPKLFEAVREKFGFDTHLLHDVHHRLTPIEAARLGKSVEPYRLFWMEDPTPAENQAGFRLIREHTVTPIAVGEVFNSIWDCKQLIEEQLIDYIRATLTHAGGITHLKRIADFAALYQVRTGCHGPSDLSPVCMGAALHFDLWVPNFGVQEYMGFPKEALEVFPHAWSFDRGMMHPGEAPGHGVDIDEKLAAKYPYDPAYLPVARLEDGTLWNW